jgi:PAS domain-containing protein
MKGSQGLEALASICGGASKALSEERNDNSNQVGNQKGNALGIGTQPPNHLNFSRSQINSAVSNSDNNSSQQQQQQQRQNQGMQQVNPQLAVLLNSGLNSPNNMSNSNDGNLAFQQMFYLNLLQNQQNQQSSNNVVNLLNQQSQAGAQFIDQNALAMLLALQQQQQQQAQNEASSPFQQQQQQQQHQSQFHSITQQQQSREGGNNSLIQQNTNNDIAMMNDSPGTTHHQSILMKKHSISLGDDNDRERSDSMTFNPEDKKMLKRAANRRSAQLSRKRKKQYIEDLKEENSDLRRMELILKSIPDLIVSFDSSGKIGFVSQSVSKFLEFTPAELEGKSFWDRLCFDSVRLLKAAFMDALAARENDSTSTPLGNGVWELRLQDKNKQTVLVTLNGVVHFTGDAPECVCSIRMAREDRKPDTNDLKPTPPPQQSVFGGEKVNSKNDSEKSNNDEGKNPRLTAQISDADSNSGC